MLELSLYLYTTFVATFIRRRPNVMGVVKALKQRRTGSLYQNWLDGAPYGLLCSCVSYSEFLTRIFFTFSDLLTSAYALLLLSLSFFLSVDKVAVNTCLMFLQVFSSLAFNGSQLHFQFLRELKYL